MVEAVITIVFLVLLWQLSWMMLNHYQAKQHAAQLARQGAWQWAMRDSCDPRDKPTIRGSTTETEANEDEYPPVDADGVDPTARDIDVPPVVGDPKSDTARADAKTNEVIDKNVSSKGNMAMVRVDRSYYSNLYRRDTAVPVKIELECNPAGKARDLLGMAGGIFGMFKLSK